MNPPHAGLVLAAGGSRRLGQPKQLLTRAGRSLLQHSVQLLLDTGAAPILVIIGAHAARMRAELHGWPVTLLEHPGWRSGLASTLQRAADACQHWHASHILVLGIDQPRLTRAHLDALLAASSATPGGDILSGYADTAGIPALLRRTTLLAAKQLHADTGLRHLLRQQAETRIIPCPALADDIDTPADLASAREQGWVEAASHQRHQDTTPG